MAELYAMYAVEAISATELRGRIVDRLTPQSDEQMFKIAYCPDTDTDCIVREAEELFAQRGYLALSWPDTLRLYAAAVSRQILSGGVTAQVGADLIAKATQRRRLPSDFHELDTFRYASSEMSERPEDAEMFRQAIANAAAQIIAAANSMDEN